MVKHTPGPWKAHPTGHSRSGKPDYEIHWSDDGECVAEVVHGEADAHLIAAAPELLEALKRSFEVLKTASRQLSEDHRLVLSGRGWGWMTIAQIECVIARAEGEE